MKTRHLLIGLSTITVARLAAEPIPPARVQTAEDQAKSFELPEGNRMDLVLSEPEV